MPEDLNWHEISSLPGVKTLRINNGEYTVTRVGQRETLLGDATCEVLLPDGLTEGQIKTLVNIITHPGENE